MNGLPAPANLIQWLTLGVTIVLFGISVLFIPLVKAALKGETKNLLEDHDKDKTAHPELTLSNREAVSGAAISAAEAKASAARAELALKELKEEVRNSLGSLSEKLTSLHEAFTAHDSWERGRRVRLIQVAPARKRK